MQQLKDSARASESERRAVPVPLPPSPQSFREEWGDLGRKRVRVVAEQAPWSGVVQDVCRQAELAVVLPPEGKESQPISATFDYDQVVDALRELGKLRGLEPVLKGRLVSFHEAGVGSIGVVVPGFLKPEDAKTVVSSVVGSEGSVNLAGPHVVVSGTPEAVDRSTKLNDVFAANEPGQWLVTVWIVELNSEIRDKLGVELSLSGAMQGMIGGGPAAAMAHAILQGTITGEQSSRSARLLNEATIALIEGQSSTLKNVQSVPIPEHNVSPEGTVTTTGYSFIEAGLIMELSGRAVPGGGLYLDVKPELSSVTGFVQDAPLVSKRSMVFPVMLADGDWCIVAGLDEYRDRKEHTGLLGLSRSADRGSSSVLVIMRATRVARTGQPISKGVGVDVSADQ